VDNDRIGTAHDIVIIGSTAQAHETEKPQIEFFGWARTVGVQDRKPTSFV
jgi:hypothetical protein